LLIVPDDVNAQRIMQKYVCKLKLSRWQHRCTRMINIFKGSAKGDQRQKACQQHGTKDVEEEMAEVLFAVILG